MKVGVFKIGASEGVQGGTNVQERIDGEGESGGAKVFGEFLNITGIGEVIPEHVGVKGNGHGVDRSRHCSQRDRRKTIRRGGGRAPACFRVSRRRARSIIDNRRRKGRSGGKGGGMVRHDDGVFIKRETGGGTRRGVGFYRRSGRTWHVSSPVRGPRSLPRPNILSIRSGRNGRTGFRGGE